MIEDVHYWKVLTYTSVTEIKTLILIKTTCK
jgi:hypothetical protein